MPVRRRVKIAIAAFVLLAAFALLARWYGPRHGGAPLPSTHLRIDVTEAGDHGPGTLREAVFVADAADKAASIVVRVPRITLESTLPPIVNPHGIQITANDPGVQIDAHALGANSPVFDIDAENASLAGIRIDGCPAAAVLVRSRRFHLTATSIQGCDVGVEVAGNAREVAIEHNRFDGDRIGIRFGAASPNSEIVKNEFSGSTDGGIWLVASQPGTIAEPISVHDNQFNGDRSGVVLGNVAAVLEHNDFTAVHDNAVHVIGEGAVVRNNRIISGAAAGVVVENARGALIEGNDLANLQGYAILLRGSADSLVRNNRIHGCGYGMAFVLGDVQRPNTALDNSLIDLKYDGIDVVGDSPILRRNQVFQARVNALHVENFTAAGGAVTRAQPLLDGNSFPPGTVASKSPAPPR